MTAPVSHLPDALLVPQQAVVELQGNHIVSVVGSDSIVHPTPVQLGPTIGPMQVISKGLKPGDKVVVGGVEKVKPGMKVNVQPYTAPARAAAPEGKKSE